MYKVLLCSRVKLKEYKSKGYNILDNFFMGKSVVLISGENDTGNYYIKNFPKDLIITTENESEIKSLGIKINDDQIKKNLFFKKKEDITNTYIVKPLDTIKSICTKFDIEENVLISTNKLTDKRLFIGQILKIDF